MSLFLKKNLNFQYNTFGRKQHISMNFKNKKRQLNRFIPRQQLRNHQVNYPKNDIAIVLITRSPDNVWLNFLNNFSHYDIYVSIDNTDKDFTKLYDKVKSKITFIQISDEYCKSFGYKNALIPTGSIPNKPTAWDKALFYFSLIRPNYKHVWFIEDDVFFLKESVIKNIDDNYEESDLLTPFNDINDSGTMSGWENWYTIAGKMNTPWCRSMVCACRLSNRLLGLVKKYVDDKHTLVYHEAFFNTLAYQNNYKIDNPQQLSTVHYNTRWDENNLNLDYFYHPIKNIQIHNSLRHKNCVFFDNLFNNVNYLEIEKFYFDAGVFILRHYQLPDGFNFCCYRENNDMRNWSDEAIAWHWFTYGQRESRKYKD
jgi:hypothetical protein